MADQEEVDKRHFDFYNIFKSRKEDVNMTLLNFLAQFKYWVFLLELETIIFTKYWFKNPIEDYD